jgi:predicted transcriptional regulator
MEAQMKMVTIGVAPLDTARQRMAAAFKGKKQSPRITFPSHELMWKLLTPKRMDLLRQMAGAGALGVREIARRTGRDVKGVHGDLQALEKVGIIGRGDDAKYLFPYDALHVDFVLKAA